MKLFKILIHKILGNHEWTCKAQEGIAPVSTDIEGFKEYAKMYCRICGKESELNHRLDNFGSNPKCIKCGSVITGPSGHCYHCGWNALSKCYL